MPNLPTALGLIAVVLVGSALASGLVERWPISFPILFLGLGFLLGEHGPGLIRIGAHDPTLEAVATVSLAFVLFLDAVKLQPEELSREWLVPVLTLGPGTLGVIASVAVAGHFLVGTTWVQSLLLGAILASTDPVVLRDVVRNPRIPQSIQRALSVEAGVNDVIVLPIIIIVAAISLAEERSAGSWLWFLTQLFILG
ncbi:MAG: cation:proton antiporter, partial [Chloroflexota bacterium]|nr:cation:proton antiporter [Chloroflexota bacterium]